MLTIITKPVYVISLQNYTTLLQPFSVFVSLRFIYKHVQMFLILYINQAKNKGGKRSNDTGKHVYIICNRIIFHSLMSMREVFHLNY